MLSSSRNHFSKIVSSSLCVFEKDREGFLSFIFLDSRLVVFLLCECRTLLLLDIEGLGDTGRDMENDTKLWVLGFLLPSLLIYNVPGVINRASTETLAAMLQVSERVRVFETGDDAESGNFSSHWNIAPQLLFVLRDFSLSLGEESEKQYLTRCLHELNRPREGDNRGTEVLERFGGNIDLLTISPPPFDSEVLRLEEMPFETLPPRFQRTMNSAVDRILGQSAPKTLCQVAEGVSSRVNGPLYLEFVRRVVASLNSGDVIVLNSLVDDISRNFCEQGKADGLEAFRGELGKQDLFPVEDSVFMEIRKRGETVAAAAFGVKAMGRFKTAAFKELQQRLEEEAMALYKLNQEASRAQCQKVLSTNVMKRLEEELSRFRNMGEFDKRATELEGEYEARAVGPEKIVVLTQYRTKEKAHLMEMLMGRLKLDEEVKRTQILENQNRALAEEKHRMENMVREAQARSDAIQRDHAQQLASMEARQQAEMGRFREEQADRLRKMTEENKQLQSQIEKQRRESSRKKVGDTGLLLPLLFRMLCQQQQQPQQPSLGGGFGCIGYGGGFGGFGGGGGYPLGLGGYPGLEGGGGGTARPGGGTVSGSVHRTCMDGSYDMRCRENWGLDKHSAPSYHGGKK